MRKLRRPPQVTPAQVVSQLRQELATNERIAELLLAHARAVADKAYRDTAKSLDHAFLLRQTGAAAGVETFVRELLPSRFNDRDAK